MMNQLRSIKLETDQARLALLPELGARVTELTDKRTGRNWLTTGGSIEATRDAAVYGGDQSIGWDECFPSIGATPEPNLNRDHGDLWGRPHVCEKHGNTVKTIYKTADYTFQRDLTLTNANLTAQYKVMRDIHHNSPFAYMWSQHCLLALNPGERVVLNGLDAANPPIATDYSNLMIQPASAHWAHKSYAKVRDQADISVLSANAGLRFRWMSNDLPWCGLWLDYGGWPAENPVHQVAIEPTTAPAENPSSAAQSGFGRQLQPGQTDHWSLKIELFSD